MALLAVVTLLVQPVPSASASSPVIGLSPASGGEGTVVTVDGRNFRNGRHGVIVFGGTRVGEFKPTGRDSTFTETFEVPPGHSGEVLVVADSAGRRAQQSFHVTDPEPAPDPGSPLDAAVLVVVDAETPSGTSQTIIDHLTGREATVTSAPDEVLSGTDTEGVDVIVVSPDVSASAVGSALRAAPVPQVNLRSSNWRPHNQALGQDARPDAVTSLLTIVDPEHPAAAGRTGTIDVGAPIGWQLVDGSPDAHTVASTTGGEPALAVYEAGSAGVGEVFFPARRAVFGIDEDGWAHANDALWALFDGVLDWAVAGEVVPPPTDPDPDRSSNPNPVDPADATHLIPRSMDTADGQGNMAQVKPGDVVAIESGYRGRLRLRNFHGTPDNPIVFVNDGGVVNIADSAGTYAGIDIRDSSHIRVSGSGAPGGVGRTVGAAVYEPGMSMDDLEGVQHAGIRVRGVERGVAFKFWESANDMFPDGGVIAQGLEIDHLDLSTTKNGVHGPESDRLSNDYTLVGYRIHHNHIHRTDTHEGMYLGSGNYPDPYADTGGWEIDHNFIHRTGRDAMQVGNAWYGDSRIHHNVTYSPGHAETQDSFGIILRRGTAAQVYGNHVFDSGRDGIRDQGINGSRFFNNVIARGGHFSDGTARGIRISTSRNDAPPEHLVGNAGGARIWNNTIVGFPDHAIHFTNDADHRANVARNNLLWDNGGTIRFSSGSSGTTSHNLSTDPRFVGGDDYRVRPSSPAIDAGLDLPGLVDFDFLGTARPQGSAWDIGAHEHADD